MPPALGAPAWLSTADDDSPPNLRRTETAAAADRHLFIRPGTDVFLLWGIIHVLFAENLVRLGRLHSTLRGLDEVRTLAAELSPEIAAERTGIPAVEIRRLARELSTHDRAVCYGRIGTSTQEFGTQCTWLATRVQTGPFAAVKRKAWQALGALGVERLLASAVFFGPFGARAGAGRITWKMLREATHGIDLGALRPQMPERLLTKDGKIDLAPARLVDDVDRLRTAHTQDSARELRLIGRRTLRSANSWVHNSPRLVKGRPRCTLLIHPEDAAARGIESGSVATVSSNVGRVEVEAEITTQILKGVVSLPHGWGHDRPGAQMHVAAGVPGASYNDVADDRLVDALSGTAAFNGTRVTVELCRATATDPRAASVA